MSLIMDALRKAQQLRLKEGEKIPFFPSARTRLPKGSKRWFLLFSLGTSAGLFILLIVLWNPSPFFQGLKTGLPSQTLEKKNPEPIIGRKVFEEPVKAIILTPLPEGKTLPSEKPDGMTESVQPKSPSPEGNVETAQTSKPRKKGVAKERVGPPSKIIVQPSKDPPTKKETSPTPEEEKKDLAIAPSTAEIITQFNLAVQLQNQQDWMKAIQAYQKVIEWDPTYFEAYNNLGLLYQEIGDLTRALKAYQRALEINPSYEKSLNNLGILHYLQGRDEEAIKVFEQGLSINPNNLESHLNLGILYRRQGQWEKAIDSLKKALHLNPLSGETHYNMALLYEDAKQVELAIGHYQKFIQLASKNYPVLASKVQRHLETLMHRKR